MSGLKSTLLQWLEPNGTETYLPQEDCSDSQDEDCKQRMQLVYFQYCALIFFFLFATTCVYYHEMLMNVRKGQTSACKPGTDFPGARNSCGTYKGRGNSSSFYRAKSTMPQPSAENRRMPPRSDQRFLPAVNEGHRPMYKSNLTYQRKVRVTAARACAPADKIGSSAEDGSTCANVSELSGSGEGESLSRLKPDKVLSGQCPARGQETALISAGSSLQGSRATLVGRGTAAGNQTEHLFEVYAKDRKNSENKLAEELQRANQTGPVFCSLDGNASHSHVRVPIPYKEILANINPQGKDALVINATITKEQAAVSHTTPTTALYTSSKPSVEDATVDLMVDNIHSICNKYSATSQSSQEQANLNRMEEKDHEMIWKHLIGSRTTTEQKQNCARHVKDPKRAQQPLNIDKMSEIYLVKTLDRTQALVLREQAADCSSKIGHSSNWMVLKSKNSTDLREDYSITSRTTGRDGQQKGLIHCQENRDSPSCFSFTLNEKYASQYKTDCFAYPQQLGGGDQQTNIKGLADLKVITKDEVKESTPHELLEVSVRQKYVVKRSPNTQGPCKVKEPRICHTFGLQHVAESKTRTKSPKFRKSPTVTENPSAKKKNYSPRFHLRKDKPQGFPQKLLTPKQRSISPPVASIMLTRHKGYSKIITRKDMVKFSPESLSRQASSVLPVNILSQVKEAIETLERSYAFSESSLEKSPCPTPKKLSRKMFSPCDVFHKVRKDDLTISSKEHRHTINDQLSPTISITGGKQRSRITKHAILTSELPGFMDPAVGSQSPEKVNVNKGDVANPSCDSVAVLNIVLQVPVKVQSENKFQSCLDPLRPKSNTSQRGTERQPLKPKGANHSELSTAKTDNVSHPLSPVAHEEPMMTATSPPKPTLRSSKKKNSPIKQKIKSSSVNSELVCPEPSYRPQFHSSPRKVKMSSKSPPHYLSPKNDKLSGEIDIITVQRTAQRGIITAQRSPNKTGKPDCSTEINRASSINANSTSTGQSNAVFGESKRSEADILSSLGVSLETEAYIHVIPSKDQKHTHPGAISEFNDRLKSKIPIPVKSRNGEELSKQLKDTPNAKSERPKLRVCSNPDNCEKDIADSKYAWDEKAISSDQGSPSGLKSNTKHQVPVSTEPKVEIKRDHFTETTREVGKSMSKKIITGGRRRLQNSFSLMDGLSRSNQTNRDLTSESSSFYQSNSKQPLNSGFLERGQARPMVFGTNWLQSSREKELHEKNSLKPSCFRANSFSPASTSRYRSTRNLVNTMGIRFLPYPRVFPQVGISTSLYPSNEIETKPEENAAILNSNSKLHSNQAILKPKEPLKHQTSPSVLLYQQLLNKFHTSSRFVTNTSISFSRAAGRRSHVNMVPGSDRQVKRVTSNANSLRRLAMDHRLRPVRSQSSKNSGLRFIKSARSVVSDISAAGPLAGARHPFSNNESPHDSQTTIYKRMTSHSCELTQAGHEPTINSEHTHTKIGVSSLHTPQIVLLNDDKVQCQIPCEIFKATQKETHTYLPSSRETFKEAGRATETAKNMRRGSNVSVKEDKDKDECSSDRHLSEPTSIGREILIDLTQLATPVKGEGSSNRVLRKTFISEKDSVCPGTPKNTPNRTTKSSSDEEQQKSPDRPFAKFDASRLVIDKAYVKDIQDTSMISDTLKSSSTLPTRKAPKYSYTIYTYKTKCVRDEEVKEVEARSKHALNIKKNTSETLRCTGKKFTTSQYHQPKVSTSMPPLKPRHEVSQTGQVQHLRGHSVIRSDDILSNRRQRGEVDSICKDSNTGSRTVEQPDDEIRSDLPATNIEVKETNRQGTVLTTSQEKTDMSRYSPPKTASKSDLSPASPVKKDSVSSSLERTATPTYHFTEVECPDESSCRRTKLVRNVPTEILFASAPKVARREDSGQHSSERSEISSRRAQAEARKDRDIIRGGATLDFDAAHGPENLRPAHKLLGDYQTGKRDSNKIHRTGTSTEGLEVCRIANEKKESLHLALFRRPTFNRQYPQRRQSEMDRQYSSRRNTPAHRANLLNLRLVKSGASRNNEVSKINRNYSKPWRVGHVAGSSKEAMVKDCTSQNEGWLQPTSRNRPLDIRQESRNRSFSFSSIPFTINAKFTFRTCDSKNRNTPSTPEQTPKALARKTADDACVRCPLRYFPAEVTKMEAESSRQKKMGIREETASSQLVGFRDRNPQLEAEKVSYFRGIEELDTGPSLHSTTSEKRHHCNVGVASKPMQKQDEGQVMTVTPAIYLNGTKNPLKESDEDTHCVYGPRRNQQRVFPLQTPEDQSQQPVEGYKHVNDCRGSPRDKVPSPCLQPKDSKSLSLSDRPDLLSEIDINCRTGVDSDEQEIEDKPNKNFLNISHRSRENAALDCPNRNESYIVRSNHKHLQTLPDENKKEPQNNQIDDDESARRLSQMTKRVRRGSAMTSTSESGRVYGGHSYDLEGRRTHSAIVQDHSTIALKMDRLHQKVPREAHKLASSQVNSSAKEIKESKSISAVSPTGLNIQTPQSNKVGYDSDKKDRVNTGWSSPPFQQSQSSFSTTPRDKLHERGHLLPHKTSRSSACPFAKRDRHSKLIELVRTFSESSVSNTVEKSNADFLPHSFSRSVTSLAEKDLEMSKNADRGKVLKSSDINSSKRNYHEAAFTPPIVLSWKPSHLARVDKRVKETKSMYTEELPSALRNKRTSVDAPKADCQRSSQEIDARLLTNQSWDGRRGVLSRRTWSYQEKAEQAAADSAGQILDKTAKARYRARSQEKVSVFLGAAPEPAATPGQKLVRGFSGSLKVKAPNENTVVGKMVRMFENLKDDLSVDQSRQTADWSDDGEYY